jgi:DNA-binding Lrp family transcriptional regulator
MPIDTLDRKILNIILENSRLSYRQIAKRLKVSAATVIARMGRMEKEKTILRYTAEIDYSKAGYDIKAMIELRISKGKLIEVERKIARHPSIYGVYDVTGDFDAVLLARFRSRGQLDRFLKEIQTYEFVERTKTSLILNPIKERQEPLEP